MINETFISFSTSEGPTFPITKKSVPNILQSLKKTSSLELGRLNMFLGGNTSNSPNDSRSDFITS